MSDSSAFASPVETAAAPQPSSAETGGSSAFAPSTVQAQEDGGKGSESLAAAQRERDSESVGPPVSLGAVRRVTADELDPHRAWTVQSGIPFPQDTERRTTRFSPVELPDPQKAVDAGLIPVMLAPHLIDEGHETQPPSANPPMDHPFREANADNDPGYKASQQTAVTASLEAAQAQKELTGSYEDRAEANNSPKV